VDPVAVDPVAVDPVAVDPVAAVAAVVQPPTTRTTGNGSIGGSRYGRQCIRY